MKQITFLFILCFSYFGAFAQNNPVSWDTELSKKSEHVYELKMTANMKGDWVVYSQFLDEGGPIPTSFEINLPEGATLKGNVSEPEKAIKEMDPLFEMMVTKYKGPAVFVQEIESEQDLEEINGSIYFMTCDNTKCLPPTNFEFVAKLAEK